MFNIWTFWPCQGVTLGVRKATQVYLNYPDQSEQNKLFGKKNCQIQAAGLSLAKNMILYLRPFSNKNLFFWGNVWPENTAHNRSCLTSKKGKMLVKEFLIDWPITRGYTNRKGQKSWGKRFNRSQCLRLSLPRFHQKWNSGPLMWMVWVWMHPGLYSSF